MRNFPWSWDRDGDEWEAKMSGGGPRGRGFGPGERPERGERPDRGERGERPDRGERGGPPPRPSAWGLFGGAPFGGGPFGNPEFWFRDFAGGGGRRGGGGGRRGGPGGGWGPFGRGPKVRRGDVRAAILSLLSEQSRNGYQIIQEIAERSNGHWKPSSGSVYPALQLLEDEGLVEVTTEEGRRSFRLTEAGRTYVEQHKDEISTPWDTVTAGIDNSTPELFPLLGQVAMAAVQVSQAATPAQMKQARQVLADARRGLYQILAEGEGEAQAESEAEGTGDTEEVSQS
jgi:DNA-binding PadR family transcriptional regulator